MFLARLDQLDKAIKPLSGRVCMTTRFYQRKLLTGLLVLNLFIALPLLAAPPQLTDWQSPSYIQKAFNEIALKNEYRNSDRQVLKWHQPIKYRFHYHKLSKNPMVEQLFKDHLTHLSQITGLSINQTHNKNNANVVIYITRDRDYGKVIQRFTNTDVNNIERDSHCMGSFKTQQHQIIKGQVVIPIDHVFSRGLLVSCVVEETTQLLGLPNDSDWVNPSIANDLSKIELLTGLDYLMLKILYDKKLKAGMTYQQAQPIITKTIKRLQNSGQIRRAQHLVNEQGLNKQLR